MRIIGGLAKSHRLSFPKSNLVRPATDKVREAIFNILGNIENYSVLDLFAGSGSMGLEAASRGAKKVCLVDELSVCIKIIKQNIIKTKLNQAYALRLKIPQNLSKIKINNPFDLVFVDPPYDKDLILPTLTSLKNHKLIDAHSEIIIEHSPREEFMSPDFICEKTKKYGQTLVSFLHLDLEKDQTKRDDEESNMPRVI